MQIYEVAGIMKRSKVYISFIAAVIITTVFIIVLLLLIATAVTKTIMLMSTE